MTLDQAIRLIDPATTAEELERIYYYGGFHGNEATDAALNEAIRIALEVMRNCCKENNYYDGQYQDRQNQRTGT